WPHRLHGRPHRAVAGAGRRRPPGPRRLRRTGRAGAGPRVAVVVDVLAPVIVVVLLAIVVIVVSAPLRRGVTADDERLATRVARPRGGQGGQVPRDPRRGARLPHGQALGGRLAGGGPRAAGRGDGPLARA